MLNKLHFIKMKTFYSLKDNTNNGKASPKLGKIFAICIFDKEIISRMYITNELKYDFISGQDLIIFNPTHILHTCTNMYTYTHMDTHEHTQHKPKKMFFFETIDH